MPVRKSQRIDRGASVTLTGSPSAGGETRSGFANIMPEMTSIEMSSVGFRTDTGSHDAMSAPRRIPKNEEPRIHRAASLSNFPALLKPRTVETDWATTDGRFVPLATSAGSPISMRAGMVMNEPPPATVLMNPEATPAIVRTIQ